MTPSERYKKSYDKIMGDYQDVKEKSSEKTYEETKREPYSSKIIVKDHQQNQVSIVSNTVVGMKEERLDPNRYKDDPRYEGLTKG